MEISREIPVNQEKWNGCRFCYKHSYLRFCLTELDMWYITSYVFEVKECIDIHENCVNTNPEKIESFVHISIIHNCHNLKNEVVPIFSHDRGCIFGTYKHTSHTNYSMQSLSESKSIIMTMTHRKSDTQGWIKIVHILQMTGQ